MGAGFECLQGVRIITCEQCQSCLSEEAEAAQWMLFIRRDGDSVTEAKALSQRPYLQCERCRRLPAQREFRQEMVRCAIDDL